MSMGYGSVYSTSRSQKGPTRSSTECELYGVYDVLPQIEWTKLFLEAQGYAVRGTILYQDNMSAMLLERNGKASSSKRTKHIHIRYFYIKDKVDSGEIQLKHCPTEDMLADFFTKPLQGTLFRQLRDRIMNIDPSSVYHSTYRRSVLDDNDRRSTDQSNITTDDDGKDNSNHVTNNGEALLDGNELPVDIDRRSTDGLPITNDNDVRDDGAWQDHVTEDDVTEENADNGGWITVERKKRKDRRTKEVY